MKQLRSMSQEGFTIVEALVGITMTVILLMIIMNFMANYFAQHAINTAKSELLVSSQRALDTIGQDIRLSASADSANRWMDANAPDAPANQLSWQSDANQLVLATAAEDDDGNILFADASQYISEKNNNIYFVDNGTLYKRTLAAPVDGNRASTSCPSGYVTSDCPGDKILAENVSSFTITYLSGTEEVVEPTNARAIEMRLELAQERFGKDVTAGYTARMVFRND